MTNADSSDQFPVGTLVWAKVQGFPFWPAKVEQEADLPAHVLKAKPPQKAIPVFFFGSHEFGWIQSSNLQDYQESKDILSKKNKSKQFLKGLEEIEDSSLWPEMSSFQSFVEPERKRKSISGSGPAKKQKTDKKVQIGSDPKDRLMKLRLKLQMFLQQAQEYSVHDYQKANQYLTETEKVEMDVNLFKVLRLNFTKETKIGKVIKHLSKKSISQHEISARCKALTEKWIMELQDSINVSTPTNEKMPGVDHDGDLEMKDSIVSTGALGGKALSPLQTVGKPASPVKTDVKPASPVKMDVKPASPVKTDVKPSSPVKMDAKPSSPVKTDVKPPSPVKMNVQPASPVKEVVKLASPVKKDAQPLSPQKEAAKPASPVKTLVSPASPKKESLIAISVVSPVKEGKTSSPQKANAKPTSPLKETAKATAV